MVLCGVCFSGVNLFRFRDGKGVEIWNHRDNLGLMQQLGVSLYAGAPPDTDSDLLPVRVPSRNSAQVMGPVDTRGVATEQFVSVAIAGEG